jgi:alkanesulfonate monooxygenase SsuD/methylene tetrahydromethanopterin reductase-like flavin-dependent oxidoreductase (luciferase family)
MRRSLFFLLDHHPELGVPPDARLRAAIAQAGEADTLGFAGVWVAEHHFRQLGLVPNPAVLLAAMAARTRTIRLGSAVAVVPMRPPLLTAEDYALVDAISGGRLDLGVGSGNEFELAGRGVAYEERHQLLQAGLDEILARFRASTVRNEGYDTLNVPVSQRPHPPVYVAAMDPGAAADVGRRGHHLLTLVTPLTAGHAAIADLVTAYEQGLAEGDHDRATRDAVVVVFGLAAPTDHEARQLAGPALARVLHAMAGVDVEPDAAFDHMRDHDLAAIGPPDHVEPFLGRLEALGVQHVAFLHGFGGLEDDHALHSIRLLAGPQA